MVSLKHFHLQKLTTLLTVMIFEKCILKLYQVSMNTKVLINNLNKTNAAGVPM